MKTKTVNALQDLYVAYGGTASDVANINNIPDLILALSQLDISSGNGGNSNANYDSDTILALSELYVANGGNATDIANITTVSGMINAIATLNSITIDVLPEDGESTLFDVQVKTYQKVCLTYPDNIVGYWLEVDGGIAQSGPLSGTGYFIALKFENTCNADRIRVGVDPSESNMGLVELDEDMNAVFKISDFSTQKIVVEVTKDNIVRTLEYKIYLISVS